MALPVVAVVGRPNVGKSTLFNKLIGKRLSIVEDTPGVTRDRIYAKGEWRNRQFMLVDTGGIETSTEDVILKQMRQQAELAIERADVIILVTDVRCGVTADDSAVASMLQKSGKPVILAVNKCDTIGEPPMELYEFYNLGIGDPYPISAAHGHGTGDMLDALYEYLPEEDAERITSRLPLSVSRTWASPRWSTASPERNVLSFPMWQGQHVMQRIPLWKTKRALSPSLTPLESGKRQRLQSALSTIACCVPIWR